MWVPGYSAEEYAPSVGGAGQRLLQGARAWVRAPGVALGAPGCYGWRHRVNGEGSHRALCVVGDDRAEVRQSCCAAFSMVYPESLWACACARQHWVCSLFDSSLFGDPKMAASLPGLVP